MSSSYPFTGSGFTVESATVISTTIIRVRFTSDPLQTNPVGANDALNPAQYTLAGPSSCVVSSCSSVAGDSQSIQLNLGSAMAVGSWVLTCSVNIQTATATPLAVPRTAAFTVSATASVSPLSHGAETDSAEMVIRKHLSPAMKGSNWDALIAALGESDQVNWDNARSAFDQLFISSASGSYLEKRAADVGISKPKNVGISDYTFRSLAINLTSNKVVHQAIREILEVYYGIDSSRAYAETELEGPFSLSAGMTLEWTVDEFDTFEYTFVANDFSNINSATALEIAASLTKWMDDLGSDAFALAVTNPLTGNTKVRIYSGKLGLGSFVRVTGGTAQDALRFPAYLEVYSGDVSGDAYSWDLTQDATSPVDDSDITPDNTRLTLVETPPVKVDLSVVQEGDYVIIGDDSQFADTGIYEIEKVKVFYDAAGDYGAPGDLVQQVYLSVDLDISGTDSAVQLTNSAYRFFRPIKNTVNASNSRTVVVAQGQDGTVNISIPATTQVVSRTALTAAYGKENSANSILRLQRKPNGVCNITTESSHGLVTGDYFTVDGIVPDTGLAYFLASADVGPDSGDTDSSWVTRCSNLVPHTGVGLENGTANLLLTGTNAGKVLCIGGWNMAAAAFVNESAICRLFEITATGTEPTAGEAQGATLYTYSYTALASMAVPRSFHSTVEYTNWAGLPKVLVTGGYDRGGAPCLTSNEIYDPDGDSWAVGTNPVFGGVGLAGHISINDSVNKQIYHIGGANNNTTASTWFYHHDYTVADPTTASSSLSQPNIPGRVQHQAVQLSDGRILVIGGRTLTGGGTFDNGVDAFTEGDISANCELYDPDTNTWTDTGTMTLARYAHQAVVLPDDKVVVIGGIGRVPSQPGVASEELLDAEFWDPDTETWTYCGTSEKAWNYHIAVYLPTKNKIMITGGKGFSTAPPVEYFNVSKWEFETSPTTLDYDRGPVYGATLENDTVLILGGNNGTTSYTDQCLYMPASDGVSAGGLNGNTFKVVSTPTATTLTFNSAIETYTCTGTITADDGATLLPVEATAASSTNPGPYIFETNSGVSVTGATTTILQELSEGSAYSRVLIDDATDFPDEDGYVVFGFGYEYQSQPVKYFGKYEDPLSPGDWYLKTDFRSVFGTTVPNGSSITLLESTGFFQSDSPGTLGVFYVTDSNSGRIAAIADIGASLAAGIENNTTVVYPGDRGLGGEGHPTEDANKLSDIVEIYGE